MRHLFTLNATLAAVLALSACAQTESPTAAALASTAQTEQKTTSTPALPHKNSAVKMDTASTSLDWPGTYSSTLPCADCAGIRTEVKLLPNLQFEVTQTHQGKTAQPVVSRGAFKFEGQHGNIIALPLAAGQQLVFFVRENALQLLNPSTRQPMGSAPYYTFAQQAAQ